MHDEIFNKLTCSHPGFAVALPPKLDQKVYITIYAKIFATLRYDCWQDVAKYAAANHDNDLSKVGDREFVEMWRKHWD